MKHGWTAAEKREMGREEEKGVVNKANPGSLERVMEGGTDWRSQRREAGVQKKVRLNQRVWVAQ